jgi:hypothetical protein
LELVQPLDKPANQRRVNTARHRSTPTLTCPDDGPKPKYSVNPAHAPGALRPGKTALPADADSAYKRAFSDDPTDARHWYGRGDDGTIYRFSESNDGKMHFSGADAVGDGIRSMTDYERRRLNGE